MSGSTKSSYHTVTPLVSLPAWFHSVRLYELKGMCLQVLFESGQSASGVLSSPSNQLLGIWAEVAELLRVAEHFTEAVRLEL